MCPSLLKATKYALAAALGVVALGAPGVLWGSEDDCTFGGGSGTCFNAPPNWGTLQPPSASGTLTNSTFTDGSYAESTYRNTSGVWTYFFTFTSSTPPGFNVTNFRTGAGSGFTEQDHFDSLLSYGEVTDNTTGGGSSCQYAGGTVNNCSFLFEPGFLQVNLGGTGLPSGDTFSFYAQSQSPDGPGAGTFSAQSLPAFDDGSAVDPALPAVPEASTLVLVATGLAFVAGARRNKRFSS